MKSNGINHIHIYLNSEDFLCCTQYTQLKSNIKGLKRLFPQTVLSFLLLCWYTAGDWKDTALKYLAVKICIPSFAEPGSLWYKSDLHKTQTEKFCLLYLTNSSSNKYWDLSPEELRHSGWYLDLLDPEILIFALYNDHVSTHYFFSA